MLEERKTINKNNLKSKYGFTDSLIKKFLQNHYKEVRNPCYASAAPMKLYYLDEVEKIIDSQEFKIFIEKSKKRQEIAKKSVKTKELKAIEFAQALNIQINSNLTYKELLINAINSYNDFNFYKENFCTASLMSDSDFLNRITVNYIRHELTDYEALLYNRFGITGKNLAIDIIRIKIYNKIKNNYPMLSDECNKQMIIRNCK